VKNIPKISVVTVCFNAASCLEKAIVSVLNQNYPNLEYIVIDGGSTDGTLGIIHQYESQITCWVSEPDKGISDAFNKGIAKATGDIIGILNADDWYEPNTLQIIAANFHNGDVLHGKMQYWRDNRKDYLVEGNHALLLKEMTVNHPTVFVKKSVYNRFGTFKIDFRYTMDYEMLLRFFLKGIHFLYIPEVVANMSFAGTSDRNWDKAIKESRKAKLDNGLAKIETEVYYWKQLTRTFIARGLKEMGMEGIVGFYRKHFAMLRKTKK
jgi:glycosyltransferase involved in cell wall biosynthesis